MPIGNLQHSISRPPRHALVGVGTQRASANFRSAQFWKLYYSREPGGIYLTSHQLVSILCNTLRTKRQITVVIVPDCAAAPMCATSVPTVHNLTDNCGSRLNMTLGYEVAVRLRKYLSVSLSKNVTKHPFSPRVSNTR